MRDVVKNQSTAPKRNISQKKRRRRKNLSLYYAMVFILVIIVGVVLSLTVLFNISEVIVQGDSPYTDAEIIAGSQISVGTNLIRLDTNKAEKNILKSMVYVDATTVKRVFPDKVIIEVTPSKEFAEVKCDNGYLLISETGKILSFTQTAQDGIPVVKGLDTVVTEVGGFVESENKEKNDIFKIIVSEMIENDTAKGITEIDISDKYNISVVYDNRITIELGSQNDISYKLKYSYMLVTEKISIKKTGVLFMQGSDSREASFVESSDLDKPAETTSPGDTSEMPDGSDTSSDTTSETTAQTTQPPETTTAETTSVPAEETTSETTTEKKLPVGLVPAA